MLAEPTRGEAARADRALHPRVTSSGIRKENSIRVLLKVSLPTERANALFKDGTFVKKMQSILQELKPEAAYFAEDGGVRTGYIVVNLQNASEIPAIAEPFFLAFNAKVEFHPAMVPEDLMAAGAAIERAVKIYG